MQKGVRDMNIDYRIRSVDGYTKIGELVSLLEHTRAVTLGEVKNLSVEQLDLIMQSSGNSIGALLKHIAAIEKFISLFHFKIVTLQKKN